MFPKLGFKIKNDKVTVEGLPSDLHLRGIKYPSKTLAELKHISVASANIMAAKFYMDSIKIMTPETDPHVFDSALIAAIVKYGSVFKPDSRGRVIDASKIFTSKILIVNKSLRDEPILMDDPDLSMRKKHDRIIKVRDQVVAHDDRVIGSTECFAALDDDFNCERVIALTQRAQVYSVIKPEREALPLCIDAVFTWLAIEKERYCQLVSDEINKLKLDVRKQFPEPTFDSYHGLPDAAERKARSEPYWEFDWAVGEKRLTTKKRE